MRELARRVGLGLAARGDIDDTIDWTRLARDAGLEGVWIHDSYFERDAITYGTAIATALAADGRRPRSGSPWGRSTRTPATRSSWP